MVTLRGLGVTCAAVLLAACGASAMKATPALPPPTPGLLRELGPHGFLVVTWDEGSSDAGCCVDAHGGRIATIVAGPIASRRPHRAYGSA